MSGVTGEPACSGSRCLVPSAVPLFAYLIDHSRGLVRWLQSVYVKPEHRAKGVFKRLFQHIQQLAKLKSDVVGIRLYGRVDYPAHFDILCAYAERNHIRLLHRYVERHNQRAKDVYQKLGFDVCDYGT